MLAEGPVAAAIDASCHGFMQYKSGIYRVPTMYRFFCMNMPDHAIAIVGYGKVEETGDEFYILRNSWTENWGEKGYAKVFRDSTDGDGEIGIQMRAMKPYFK